MSYEVNFKATVTGSYSDLDVFVQSDLVDSTGGKVDQTDDYTEHGNLVVRFRFSALNGTAVKIIYGCISDGSPASDLKNPSPISDEIDEDGMKEIKLTIPV